MQSSSESPIQDLNGSATHDFSLNLDEKILRILSFATATKAPLILHSTKKKKLNNVRS